MTVSKNELENAFVHSAQIVARYGEKYLPIFERLEAELKELQACSERLKRAMELAEKTLE